jgi:phosphoribosyl-ATP pyrophosphohydrolase
MSDTLKRLEATIAARKNASPETSYVAKLQAIVYETADLLFHAMVLLQHQGISIDEVLNELARREGVSGIEEKNARP